MAKRRPRPSIKRRAMAALNGQELNNPSAFLSPKRIDIAAKTIFARAYLRGSKSPWPEKVYREHIRAFNNFYEDIPRKTSYDDFKNSFISTIEAVKKSDDWKHTAPVERNGNYLINGSHRVAASIVLDDYLNTTAINEFHAHKWDFEFFRSKRGDIYEISEDVLDYITIEYVSLKSKNIFAAVIFPTAEGNREAAYTHLLSMGEIVNMKSFRHDDFIGKEVIKQLYFNSNNDQWNYGLSLDNARNKADVCFDGQGDLQVYIIEANLDESTRIKEKQFLRDLWKKDKHSIHITDTMEEANRVTRMFFNENSRKFMKVDRRQEFYSQNAYDMFNEYIKLAPDDIFEREKIALEGSVVLDLHNIRAAKDIDYVTYDNSINFSSQTIEKHSAQEHKYHTQDIEEILTNPKYYFYYKGYKIINIDELLSYKKNRLVEKNPKDSRDIAKIENFMSNNPQYEHTVTPHGKDESSLVSIIVPVYNVEKYLETCVNSLKNQTYRNIEIILVDDGSTDTSGKICDQLSKEDQRIQVFHQQNKGLNAARQTGFNRSSGEWILFIDSDDVAHHQAVEILKDATSEYATSIAVGGYSNFSEERSLDLDRVISEPVIHCEKNKQTFTQWLINGSPYSNVYMQTAWMKLYKRSLIETIDWEYCNYRANEDEFMSIQYYPTISSGIAIVAEDLYFYRLNQNSITRSKFSNEFQHKKISKFETIETLYEKSLVKLGKSYEEDLLLRFANQYIGYLEEFMVRGYLDDTVVREYEAYFLPKLPKIKKIQPRLSKWYQDRLAILTQGGVTGMMSYVIQQKDTHIFNLENSLHQKVSDIKQLQQPGIKVASRKLAGAVRRKIKKKLS